MKQLFEAIKAGNTEAVKALLDGDAALVNAADESGTCAFTYAKYNRREEIAQLLEERGAELDIHASAIAGNSVRISDILRANRSLVRALSRDGWTPLHLAAFFGHKAAVETLLNAGADVSSRGANAMKNTPLHAAVAGRNRDVVKVLLERGADPNARQEGGWTPLHSAAQSGDVDLIQMLITAGADPQIRADNQQNALDLALTKGHQDAVTLLDRLGTSQPQ